MKTFLPNLLILFALALCGLCAFQWKRETQLRSEVIALNQSVNLKSETVKGLQGQLKRTEADVNRLEGVKAELTETIKTNRQEIASLAKNVDKLEKEIEVHKKQIEVYKEAMAAANESIKKQNEDIKTQNEDIKKQNEQLKSLAEERNATVQKFNKLAADYNTLVKEFNQMQEDFNKLRSQAPAPNAEKKPAPK